MTRPDELRAARLAARATVSAHLAPLGDDRLGLLVDGATPVGSGIGGSTATLDVGGVPVFVKRIPLSDLERRPEHVMSTANLFGLPGFYQYGVGSAGFGAWRELAVHTMTTEWVLADDHQGFPLMYHWRVLPGGPAGDGAHAEFGSLDDAVAYWDGSAAVRRRLEGIRDSTASIVLFVEHLPQTLAARLADQGPAAYRRVDEELSATVAFMRSRGLIHFDAHFHNLLTDGEHVYFSDFGLALSTAFELSADEREFFDRHRDYDRAHVAGHLLLHHVADSVRGGTERDRFVRDWAEGARPQAVPAPTAALLTRHARTATVLYDFRRRLRDESKRTPYPAAELADCLGGA